MSLGVAILYYIPLGSSPPHILIPVINPSSYFISFYNPYSPGAVNVSLTNLRGEINVDFWRWFSAPVRDPDGTRNFLSRLEKVCNKRLYFLGAGEGGKEIKVSLKGRNKNVQKVGKKEGKLFAIAGVFPDYNFRYS